MITIIFAPPRTGKTAFMTNLACETAFERRRNRAMQLELMQKQANGFTAIETIPQHCVSANYDMFFQKFGYSPRKSRRINPYRLGFSNPYVDTHFNLPFECICITEAQKYLNSRHKPGIPDWQSRWYEQHGHNHIDIYLDTQRYGLIDLNVRELSKYIEIMKLDILDYDRFGRPDAFRWKIRRFDNMFLFERYNASGKQDKSCYVEDIVISENRVFDMYDSFSCKPKFYQGHFDSDIDYDEAKMTVDNFDGYIKFLQEFDDELPDNFYLQPKKAA